MTANTTSDYVVAAKRPAHNPTAGYKPQTCALPKGRGVVTFPRPVPRLNHNSITMSKFGCGSHTRADLLGWCTKIARGPKREHSRTAGDRFEVLRHVLRAEAYKRWSGVDATSIISLQHYSGKFNSRAQIAEFWNTAMINAGFLSKRVIDLHSN